MATEEPSYRRRVRELRDAAERLADGEEPETVFARWWRSVRVKPPVTIRTGQPDLPAIPFHQPARRPRRVATADGRTSFHFSHRTVVRLHEGTLVEGVMLPPGAAREHCRYVEREGAVAKIAIDLSLSAQGSAADRPTAIRAEFMETDHDPEPYAQHLLTVADADLFDRTGYVSDFCSAEARSTGDRLFAMPGGGVAAAGRQIDLLLSHHSAWRLAGDESERDGSVRRPADRPEPIETDADLVTRGRGARAITAGHMNYIERAPATAIQPDGASAILSNIAIDPKRRLRFWELVEENESKPSPDRMTVDIARAPEFWARVAGDLRCPPSLRQALVDPDPAARCRFVIPSGVEMRRFLESVPGWAKMRKKEEDQSRANYRKAKTETALASFHDGRGGRIQYRVIGELPDELSMEGRMRVLRRFSREFEQRELPFNCAMHAPDFHSDEKQWHFHLDYYDRPSRILDKHDIARALAQGLTPVGAGEGEWDFAARFYKGARRDRTSRPFRRDKVKEVRDVDWIDHLRRRLAFAVNMELRREGQQPRFDPRNYDAMGIKAEPGEHMGVKLNAAEAKGEVSGVGVANERKQWRFIEQTLADRRQAGYDAAAAAAAGRSNRIRALELDPLRTTRIDEQIAAIERLERLIADTAHDADLAAELTARASSRAAKVQQVNQRWLDANTSGDQVIGARQRAHRTALRDAATSYLDRLEPMREATVEATSLCHAVGANARAQLTIAERKFEAMVADVDRADKQSRALIVLIETHRPLVHKRQDGFTIVGSHDPKIVSDNRVQAALAVHHERQEREVDRLTAVVVAKRLLLIREAGKWTFNHTDPATVERFKVLRDHPRLAEAIAQIVSPPSLAETHPSRSEPAPGMSPVNARPSEPASIAVAVPRQPDVATPAVSSTVQTPHVASQSAPVVMPPKSPPTPEPTTSASAASRSAQPPVPIPTPPQPTVARPPQTRTQDHANPPSTPVQKIIADKIVLRIGSDGQIDAEALARRGVRIAPDDRRNPRLLGRAREQCDYAQRVVEKFVTKFPGFVEGDERGYRLSSRTSAVIATFAADHDDEEMQAILKRAKVGQRVAEALPVVAAPAAGEPPQMTILERDPEMIAAAQAYLRDKERRVEEAWKRVEANAVRRRATSDKGSVAHIPLPRRTPTPMRWPPPGGDRGFD